MPPFDLDLAARRLLELPADMRYVIEMDCMSAYPNECCGILFGKDSKDVNHPMRTIVRVLPVVNNWSNASEQVRRFSIDPKQLMAAEQLAEAMGVVMVGFYHSHPSSEARPSEFDRENAWPFYSYMIVSVNAYGVKDLTSWVLQPKSNEFRQQIIC